MNDQPSQSPHTIDRSSVHYSFLCVFTFVCSWGSHRPAPQPANTEQLMDCSMPHRQTCTLLYTLIPLPCTPLHDSQADRADLLAWQQEYCARCQQTPQHQQEFHEQLVHTHDHSTFMTHRQTAPTCWLGSRSLQPPATAPCSSRASTGQTARQKATPMQQMRWTQQRRGGQHRR